MRCARRTLPLLAAAPLVLAGCAASGTSPGAAATGGTATGATAAGTTTTGGTASTPPVAPVGSGTAVAPPPSDSPAPWGSLAGCPSVGRALPAETHSAPTVDVDGDGRPDTAFIATTPDAHGGVGFGVRTASGAVISATIQSASPAARSVLFADVSGHGDVIALASDGRQVQLWSVQNCSLVPVRNVQGAQYTFDLGFTGYGTGVGCADADGVPDLLGLKLDLDPNGRPTAIERTIVTIHGAQARNGARSTVPITTPTQARLATTITCGNLTLPTDGVTTGP